MNVQITLGIPRGETSKPLPKENKRDQRHFNPTLNKKDYKTSCSIIWEQVIHDSKNLNLDALDDRFRMFRFAFKDALVSGLPDVIYCACQVNSFDFNWEYCASSFFYHPFYCCF